MGLVLFFTKPLFFVIDYLFKISGNFGTAIVLLTIAIRLIFFPLANFSFRSMAKMKAVQPEMMRLKELHKDDKVKLQQEMMALYRKEKINPASGCLPVLIQIPFFFAIYKMLFYFFRNETSTILWLDKRFVSSRPNFHYLICLA